MVGPKREQAVTLLVILSIIIIAAVFTWLAATKEERHAKEFSPAAVALGDSATGTTYTDLSGVPISLSSAVGSVVVVNSWASWSPDSAVELPLLARLSAAHADDEVRVIGINRAEPASTAERFLNIVGAAEGVELVLDPDDRYYRSIGGYAMPETIFYDRNGQVVHHHRGVMSFEQMEQYLQDVLVRSE